MDKFNLTRKQFIRAVALALAAWPAWATEPGQPAPPFELPGASGAVRLADYKGQTLYLDFWASWCVPCKQSFPWMNEMLSRYREKGLRILAINVDRKLSDAKLFLERTPARFDLAFDAGGQTPRSYGIKAMPSSVLIGPDGTVVQVHRGFSDDDRAELERSIRQALNLKLDRP